MHMQNHTIVAFQIYLSLWPTAILLSCKQLFVIDCSETEAMQMCGVPGRAENGTQISLYSAELYNPGQKTEYRYAIHPVVMSQNNFDV